MATFNLILDYNVPPKTEAEKKAADEAYNRAVAKLRAEGDETFDFIHNTYSGADVAESYKDTYEPKGVELFRTDLDAAVQDLTTKQRARVVKFVDKFATTFGNLEITVTPTEKSASGAAEGGTSGTPSNFSTGTQDVPADTGKAAISLNTGLLWCCRHDSYIAENAAATIFFIEVQFNDDNPPMFGNCVTAATYAELMPKAKATFSEWDKRFAVVFELVGDKNNGNIVAAFDTVHEAADFIRKKGKQPHFTGDEGVFATWSDDGNQFCLYSVPFAAFLVKQPAWVDEHGDTQEFADRLIAAKREFAVGRDNAAEYYVVDFSRSGREHKFCFRVMDRATGKEILQ